MPRPQAIGLCSKCNKTSTLTHLGRHMPPSFLVPSIPSSRRSLFTRRSTSFWAHSYPDNQASSSQIPYAPPPPNSAARGGRSGTSIPEEGRKQEKKQRYLDSLMDKAGELNLRCKPELGHCQDRIDKGESLCYRLCARRRRQLDRS